MKDEHSFASRDLVGLLAARHSKDVFVPECKDGPTWGGGHDRLDAWAMRRSWSKPATYGYEVKVSRGDFLKDDKWPNYLAYCNQFYFVCPQGLIEPEELPVDVGLLWASKNGARLFVKRKAVHREVEIPESLFRYILMSRAEIAGVDLIDGPPRGVMRDYWSRWLRKKQLDQAFGRRVSRAIAERVEVEIESVRRENMHLQARMGRYDDVRQALVALGLDPETPSGWSVKNRVEELMSGVPQDLDRSVNHALRALEAVREGFDRLKISHGENDTGTPSTARGARNRKPVC